MWKSGERRASQRSRATTRAKTLSKSNGRSVVPDVAASVTHKKSGLRGLTLELSGRCGRDRMIVLQAHPQRSDLSELLGGDPLFANELCLLDEISNRRRRKCLKIVVRRVRCGLGPRALATNVIGRAALKRKRKVKRRCRVARS